MAAAACAIDPTSGVRAEIEVHETLERLQQRRRISWGIEAPVTGAHPESLLRRQLERIGDDSLRKEALASLDVLEGARARVASAAGKAAELCEALANLNEAFERVSGTASLRRHGETYGARTLVYQDCRRDLQMEISEKLLIDQAVERAARIGVDERETAHEGIAHVQHVGFAEAHDDVGVGVGVRQMRERELLAVEVQRCTVGEGHHR